LKKFYGKNFNTFPFFEQNIKAKRQINKENNDNNEYCIVDAIIPKKIYVNDWELYDFHFDFENAFERFSIFIFSF